MNEFRHDKFQEDNEPWKGIESDHECLFLHVYGGVYFADCFRQSGQRKSLQGSQQVKVGVRSTDEKG